MIDSNISMEEDTELRDLVVQTLENNGVLAKVRAELRASVFLTLEEQESVLNPEPFLNKSVKQYLASSEGKLLFSLVREFLEYFGLDYTISVYDPETYFGKEYNYVGRKKLCEELGINSREPLLGEILKNTINSALNNTHKDDSNNIKLNKTSESSGNFANATFDISVPKVLQKDSTSISIDASEKLESLSNSSFQNPINVTIKDKKQNENSDGSNVSSSPPCGDSKSLANEITSKQENLKEKSILSENGNDQNHKAVNEIDLNINHKNVTTTQLEIHQNQETSKSKTNLTEYQTINNAKNKKQLEPINKLDRALYFDEIIVDGMKQKVTGTRDGELLLDELPPLPSANNTLFGDLPPLNGKKANMNDLKELMDIAQGVSQYEEDFSSSDSTNTNEQNFLKDKVIATNSLKSQKDSPEFVQSENESEEIDEEIPSSTSCIENIIEKDAETLIVAATTNHVQ